MRAGLTTLAVIGGCASLGACATNDIRGDGVAWDAARPAATAATRTGTHYPGTYYTDRYCPPPRHIAVSAKSTVKPK